jgi:hypothetical protein
MGNRGPGFNQPAANVSIPMGGDDEEQLRQAIELSKREQQDQKTREQLEEEELQKILELSLIEK